MTVATVNNLVEHANESYAAELSDSDNVISNNDHDNIISNSSERCSNAAFENSNSLKKQYDTVMNCDPKDPGIKNDVGKSNKACPPDWLSKVRDNLEVLTEDEMADVVGSLLAEVEKLPEPQKRAWTLGKMTEAFDGIMPRTLIEMSAGYSFDGDSGISMDVKPDWLDMEKFKRGQQFAQEWMFGVTYAELLSLFMMFSFQDGLKPIIATGASSTPYTAFKRYLSTGNRVKNWYTSDPWTHGTPAYNDVKAVRRLHALVRKNSAAMSKEEYAEKSSVKEPWCPALEISRRDFESACPAPARGQCPYLVIDKLPRSKIKWLSQADMSITQFAFVGLAILFPKNFGIHGSEKDIEAFAYVWRCIGYLLGIEDEYNFCRGTLEDVRARSRDILDYWIKPNFRMVVPEWEHMMRCVIQGLQYYFPGSSYETCLLDLAQVMNLHMPRVYDSLSYGAWMRHGLVRFYFNHGSKYSKLRSLMNTRLEKSLDRANNFDEEKHKELQERSAKTLESYKSNMQRNRIIVEKQKNTWTLRFFARMAVEQ